jgi:uncharacterized membrane protein
MPKPKTIKQRTVETVLPYIFIVLGSIGFLASFALTYDKIHVLQNPNYVPNCNISPILSCGSVMKTEQASLLGVPNTIFGLVAFTALITLGIMILAGGRFNRKLWLLAQIMATGGVIFMHYLFFQGVFRINAICPWCFVVWMITIPIFWYTTLYNLRLFQDKLHGGWLKAALFVRKHQGDILVVWYATIFAILIIKFWYYWKTLI